MSKKYKVCIDAGHSLVTPGKCTPPLENDIIENGAVVAKKGGFIKEYRWNKAVAHKLGEALERCGIDVVYSGFKDTVDVSNTVKANNCNAAKADLIISNHYNASANCLVFQEKIKGLVVLITANCSLASKRLAESVHNSLISNIKFERDWGIWKDRDMSGFTYTILRKTTCPAVLIEYGFMDYEHEAVKMLNEKYQEECAEATARGVCDYLGVKYVEKSNKTKYLKVLINELNIHNAPDFKESSVCGYVNKGTVLTIVEEIERTGTNMYKTKSGIYITASPKYVEVFEK